MAHEKTQTNNFEANLYSSLQRKASKKSILFAFLLALQHINSFGFHPLFLLLYIPVSFVQ